MGRDVHSWFLGLVFALILNQSLCDEVSLQGALNAISRRQQDIAGYPRYGKFYSESGVSRYPENDLVFLGSSDSHSMSNKDKSPIEYLEDIDYANKHIASPFRERTEENRLREKQKLTEIILNDARNNDDYAEILRELYQKYGQYEPRAMDYYNDMYEKNDVRKRARQFPNMGLNMVGMKKRSRSFSPMDESRYLLNVPSRNQVYQNSMAKRFPVTKRSSTYYPIPFTNEMPRQYKRSSSPSRTKKSLQTDPKVAEDLSSIFNHNAKRKADLQSEIIDKMVTKPKRTEHATETSDTNLKSTTTKKPETKESVADDKSAEKEKPIQLKKKSIDWSDYFGIDKRKKNEHLDNEWLMERYHKAIALTAKRNSESNESTDKTNKTKSFKETSMSDDKINDMDTKLKNIEYAIVDDALKMSGGTQHEDDIDLKDVQQMEDEIMSQLVAAYNLEKMRRALNEYRETIKKERLGFQDKDNQKLEEKRLSVPRKSALDSETATADNNIKCTNGDENCAEQNYRTPEDLLDSNNYGYCPKIQRACSEIASVLGQYEKMLETACVMHQMCLLCGENTWFPPTRQCNVLFLNKADYLCNEDVECKEVARHSTRYLLELNKLLKAEPLDSCEITC